MDMNEMTAFLGWCTVINLIIYILSVLFLVVFKQFTISLHSKLVGVDAAEFPPLYFTYLGNYKIGLLIFNITPYFALKLMG